jgi:hypothetical protein
VRAGFKVDYGKIEFAPGATNNLQSVVGAVRQVTEATAVPKDVRDTILQLWIGGQKKYGRCLHAPRFTNAAISAPPQLRFNGRLLRDPR